VEYPGSNPGAVPTVSVPRLVIGAQFAKHLFTFGLIPAPVKVGIFLSIFTNLW